MTTRLARILGGLLAASCSLPVAAATSVVGYDIVYVRQPRYGDASNTIWPEVFHPAEIDPGADLVLLHPDGTQEVLVAGGNGAVTDPFVSFDAQWVYYSYFPDVRPEGMNGQRGLPYAGADIYKIHLRTRQVVRLRSASSPRTPGRGTSTSRTRWIRGASTTRWATGS